MVQLVVDGPDVPRAVLEAQEENRLVLFCGAGVSIGCGLPSFRGLVERVRDTLGAVLDPLEDSEFRQDRYDRVLGLLERDTRFGAEQVRRAVREILRSPPDADLETHRSLLDLARGPDSRLRLVTTNFDRLFEGAGFIPRVDVAPRLPVPKLGKWSSLVYLHGRLDTDDPGGENLVLSSSDFGVAYLVERWASRFVAELFNHSVVLFVGYSIEDPVMRYLVDALAAERHYDERIRDAYAFVGSALADDVLQEWEAKGIHPIVYNPDSDHAVLHATLAQWARQWRQGLESKINTISDIGLRAPATLPDEEIQQFCWALQDPSAAPARKFAELGKRASLDWLAVLENHKLLDFSDQGSPPSSILSSEALIPLDNIRSNLCTWLTRHVDNPKLASWLAARGGVLHFEVRERLRRAVVGSPGIRSDVRELLLAMTSSPLTGADPHLTGWRLPKPVLDSDAPSLSALEVARCFQPWIKIRSQFGYGSDSLEETTNVFRSVWSECELAAGDQAEHILQALRSASNWRDVLADTAFDWAVLLKRALDLQAVFKTASREYDRSSIWRPSIPPHVQNSDLNGWTLLIDLNREAFEELAERDRGRARDLAAYWSHQDFPSFRRLVWHAGRSAAGLTADELLDRVLSDPSLWFWDSAIRREMYGSLDWFWTSLGPAQQERLGQIVEEGPPRDFFLESLDENEFEVTRDGYVWRVLARLDRSGSLSPRLSAHLASILEEHPDWILRGDESEDFSSWTETSYGEPAPFTLEELRRMAPTELADLLSDEERPAGTLSVWSHLTGEYPLEASLVLLELARRGSFVSDVWAQVAVRADALERQPEAQRKMLEAIRSVPHVDLANPAVLRPITNVLHALSGMCASELRPDFLGLWDVAIDVALQASGPEMESSLTAAINSDAGRLSEALLELLRSAEVGRGDGLPSAFAPRLERLSSSTEPGARLAKVMLASRLARLFDVDPDWCAVWIVPLFAWDHPQKAQGAWEGFLWSPWIRPALWTELGPHFLKCFDHLDLLGESSSRVAQILASLSIDGGLLAPREIRASLRSLNVEDLGAIAAWIRSRTEGAEDRAGALWSESVGPWLEEYWPREQNMRGDRISSEFARAAVMAGESFPLAVAKTLPFVTVVNHSRSILSELMERGQHTRFPKETLDLVNALTPDRPPGWFGPLEQLLNEIRSQDSTLATTPEFQRLHDLALRFSLRT